MKLRLILISLVIVGILAGIGGALTLEESINLALAQSPQVLVAKEKLNAAYGKLGQAKSALAPHLSLEGSLGRNYSETPTISMPPIPGLPTQEGFSLYPDEAANASSYTLSLKQTVFTGGKIFRSLRMANAGYYVAYEDLRKAQNEVLYNVSSAYYQVLKAEKMSALVKENMGILEKHLKQVEIFQQSGLVTKADVLRVETELANLKQAEIQARNGLRLAKLAFNNLLGRGLTEEVNLVEVSEKPEKEWELNDLLALAYEYHPEWRAFKLGKQISEDSLALAYGNYFPNLALVASTGKTITEYPSAGTKYDLDSWRVMLAGSWNIFDGLETQSRVYEAHANLAAMQAQEALLKNAIALEVNSAYFNLESAKERVKAAEAAEDLARRTLRLAEANFSANIGTSLSVLDAEAALHKAENDLWAARYEVELAKVRLNKAVGTKIF